jgi:hypothetical protein
MLYFWSYQKGDLKKMAIPTSDEKNGKSYETKENFLKDFVDKHIEAADVKKDFTYEWDLLTSGV